MRSVPLLLVLLLPTGALSAQEVPSLDADGLLSRPWTSEVPMACSGRMVWAAHPPGWAFGEAVHLYQLCGREGPRFDLEVRAGGRTVPPSKGTSHPSHVALEGSTGGLEVQAAKFITADDVLVADLELANTRREPVTVELEARYPFGGRVDGGRVRARVRIGALRAFYDARAPGFTDLDPAREKVPAAWWEAEHPLKQQGSKGRDQKPGASGGEVLGFDFGGRKDDYALYRIGVKEAGEHVLLLRYALGMPEPTSWEVRVDGEPRGEPLTLAPTGGWGTHERTLAWARHDLGRLDAGQHRLSFHSTAADNNTNLDGFHLMTAARADALDGDPGLPQPETRRLGRILRLKPGETGRVRLVLAAARSPTTAAQRAAAWTRLDPGEALETQRRRELGWYAQTCPAFACSDPMVTRLFAHRCYLMRKNLLRVGQGALQDWSFAEGRWNSTWYPNVISYGAAHQAREARWLRDPDYVYGHIRTWAHNAKENGIFPSHITPEGPRHSRYTDWIAHAGWEVFKVGGHRTFLEGVVDALAANTLAWYRVYDPDEDGLLLVDDHWWTGMEWQPSFFAFNDWRTSDPSALERVDLTAYAAGNASAMAEALKLLGRNEEARRFRELAARSWSAMEKVMWDREEAWFYSVHPETHEKARVKEVVGVYPFYFGLPPAEGPYTQAWASVVDPEQLWTPWPVASCSQQAPAYSQDGWPVGPGGSGCMWNGPTWPHANSLVLPAMAATLRRQPQGPLERAHLLELFASYTLAQFREGDPARPWTGEFYRGDTGAWKTAERDYFHSTWIDVLVADLIGLRPRADALLEVHPLLDADTWSWFYIAGVRYHDRDVTLTWAAGKEDAARVPGKRTGFCIYVDGELRVQQEGLEPVKRPL